MLHLPKTCNYGLGADGNIGWNPGARVIITQMFDDRNMGVTLSGYDL